MDYAVVISAIVLGLSVLATAAKFLDWFLHSDPKTMVRTVRWMLLLLIVIGIPLLVMMALREQWAGVMLLGAGMLIVGTFLKWRAILGPLNALFSHFRPRPRPFEMPPVWEEEEGAATDPKAVARAAAILEAYVRQTAPNALPAEMRRLTHVVRDDDEDEDNVSDMTVKEALEVLGLPDGAAIADVHTAHRRLMRMADPDEGGSPYLAAKIDQARDVLIDVLRRRSKPAAIGSAAPKRLPKS